jgi:hypothetical protein
MINSSGFIISHAPCTGSKLLSVKGECLVCWDTAICEFCSCPFQINNHYFKHLTNELPEQACSEGADLNNVSGKKESG